MDRQYWLSTHSLNEFVSGYQERSLIAIKMGSSFRSAPNDFAQIFIVLRCIGPIHLLTIAPTPFVADDWR
jgi:hypothetical protein